MCRIYEQVDNTVAIHESKAHVIHFRDRQGLSPGGRAGQGSSWSGLTLPQNNGLVEGKVNKLKLIKRMDMAEPDSRCYAKGFFTPYDQASFTQNV